MLRPDFTWNLGRRTLAPGERTLVMGVVNVTPDSFSDGGQFLDPQSAVTHGVRLLDEGADILDIGGESTRPGATPLSAGEELQRILPVITGLRRERSDIILSVDTYKAEVALRAVETGADIVNDVSGLRWDPAMAAALASLRCGVVLMHTRGRPDEWRSLAAPDDVVSLVLRELRETAEKALAAGIAHDRIVLDPGFGFGKRYDENYPLLSHFDRLHSLGFPLLSGPSRKSFLGRTAGKRLGLADLPPEQRLAATLAAVTASVLKGAHVVRVHDVRATVEAVAVADAVLRSAL
jgi:dihydropteroate synthase